MKLTILLTLIGVSFAAQLDVEWQQWKTKYAKTYVDDAEESVRKLVWLDNWQFVQKHNSENHTFTVETNGFADLVSSPAHVTCACIWYSYRLLKNSRSCTYLKLTWQAGRRLQRFTLHPMNQWLLQ